MPPVCGIITTDTPGNSIPVGQWAGPVGGGHRVGPDAGGGLKLLQTGKTRREPGLTAGLPRSTVIRTGKALRLSLKPPLDVQTFRRLCLFTVNMSETAEALAANQKSRRNVTIELTNITNNFCLLDPK